MTTDGTHVGLDLISLESVEDSVAEHGQAFLARVLTERERSECARDGRAVAERMAIKEAVFKALRPAADDALPWHAVETRRSGSRWMVALEGPARRLAESAGLDDWHVSVTRVDGYSAAIAWAAR